MASPKERPPMKIDLSKLGVRKSYKVKRFVVSMSETEYAAMNKLSASLGHPRGTVARHIIVQVLRAKGVLKDD